MVRFTAGHYRHPRVAALPLKEKERSIFRERPFCWLGAVTNPVTAFVASAQNVPATASLMLDFTWFALRRTFLRYGEI